jgi:hypothetical protein
MSQHTTEAIYLDQIESEFFRDAVGRCVREIVAHYGQRLVSVYVWGSVARGEAVPCVSDIELSIFIRDAYTDGDRYAWRDKEADPRLQGEIPCFRGLPPATPIQPLREGWASYRELSGEADGEILARYYSQGTLTEAEKRRIGSRAFLHQIQSDAVRVWGEDLAAEARAEPSADRAWAIGAFGSPWTVVRGAAGQPPATAGEAQQRHEWALPAGPALRRRKLARLAVLGGAYLLMAEGRFRSYRGRDVLPALSAAYPRWADFLAETERLYVSVRVAGRQDLDEYLATLMPWMDWIGQQLHGG